MVYLIDTHILLWWLMRPEKIPPKAMVAIEQSEQVYVSGLSFWEISLKYSLGKLELQGLMPEELPDHTRASGLGILECDSGMFASFHQLPRLGHRDPFDRMLIHTAIRHNMTLISRDQAFADYRAHGLKLFQA
ncbi:MAG: type II toxin-antitoxin system VapC family toxin [Chromatiales bacterium]|nr:type II toxin-antitoxin system VapC family toxin [Gammaproteobacteria bacterium]MBW6475578.1 type II toxin-antitoxin system VapC family toxin [Chromatiales bacterium]